MRLVAFFCCLTEVLLPFYSRHGAQAKGFFYSNVIRSVIDLKCEVKCERLCGQELLISQPCSQNSGEQNMSFIARIQPRGQFDLVFSHFDWSGTETVAEKRPLLSET